MSQPHVKNSYYEITANDRNVTLAAGTANVRSKAISFSTPDRTGYVLRETDMFALFVGTDPATAVADTAVVEVVITDANGIVDEQIVTADYVRVKEFQDEAKIYRLRQKIQLRPKQLLEVWVTGNLAFTTANTRMTLGSMRSAVVYF